MSPEHVVETAGLVKQFGRQAAVAGVDLRVPSGAIYALLGPNGAGKTTTLKLLLGLLRPSAGSVRLLGEPWNRRHLARVGVLVETPSLYPHLTGAENLGVHAVLLGLPRRRVQAVLHQVDLSSAGEKRVGDYSLGMKQRLGLALALLGEPEVLVLDEPTNGLDPVGVREVRSLVLAAAARGITVVISSHILAEVAQVATHVGVLVGGKLGYQGPLTDLLSRGQGYLAVETPDAESTRRFLALRHPDATVDGTRVLVPVPEEQAAGVVAALVGGGVQVLRIAYERSDLEAQFMGLLGRPGEGPPEPEGDGHGRAQVGSVEGGLAR